MVVAAVLAGGSGSRMGADIPKQFLEICGEPIIVRSIRAFTENSRVDVCIVSVNEMYLEYTNELIDRFLPEREGIYVISGGNTRGETLEGVLLFMEEKGILNNSTVITHDAVRPFITDRIINENIDAAEKYSACNTCVPAVDTIFLSADGSFISSVPDRSSVFHAQTPQSFNAEKLLSLIKKMPYDDFLALTDGCSVFTYHNENVFMVMGENYNIKITYPDDIGRGEMILKKYFN